MNELYNDLAMASMTEPAADAVAGPKAGIIVSVTELVGRVLLATLFFISGAGKVMAYAATGDYMVAAGIPAYLLPVVIATELIGSLALVLGWNVRCTAVLLAAYSVLAA